MTHGAVSVGTTGAGPLRFDTRPDAADFATHVRPGGGTTYQDATTIAAGVNEIDATIVTTQLPIINSAPPAVPAAISTGFQWNSLASNLFSRPTTSGTNAASVLMATLQNNSGANRDSIIVSYDFDAAATLGTADELPGYHVFYSFTGAPGSWQPIPELTGIETVGNQSATVALGSWPVGSLLYIVWADDNDDGQTDAAYTIDNFRINFSIPPPVILVQPSNTTNLVSRTVSLSVVADGIGLTYQWHKVGVGPINPIDNPTAATDTLVITNAQLADTGDYFVSVNNGGGGISSENAHIEIKPDDIPPQFLRAEIVPSAGNNTFLLVVDEPLCVDFATCGTDALFQFNWEIQDSDTLADLGVATIAIDGTNVTFTTSGTQELGKRYRIVVGFGGSGIADVFGNTLPLGTFVETLPSANFTATKDAEIHSLAQADTALGAAVSITVDNDDAGVAQALLQFEDIIGTGLGQIPPNALIISATLRLNQTDPGSAANMHRMLVPWDEATVTWNTMVDGVVNDGVEAVVASDALTPNETPNALLSINVTTSVQAWADGQANYGWVFRSTSTGGWDWETSESANPPTLSVVYSPRVCDLGLPVTIVTQPPATLTVNEGSPIGISITLSNNCETTYQWTKDGVNIPAPAGTAQNYSLASAVAGAGGSGGTYRLSITKNGVTIQANPTVVTVVGETTRPTVTSVNASSATTIVVVFSEDVSVATAQNTANYVITPSVSVSSAVLAADGQTVTLTTGARSLGTAYSLRIQNITDLAGTPNLLNPNPTDVPLTTIAVIDPWNSTWLYNTNNLDDTLAGTPWFSPAYVPDANWQSGNALFGTETSAGIVAIFPTPIATPLPANSVAPGDMITYYFRKEITLTAIPAGTTYAINHIIDDGAIFYLNGVEIGRLNMPDTSPILYSTRATSAGEASLQSFAFTATPGTYTLAVEVHQGGATTSSDMLFGAKVIALPVASPSLTISRSGPGAVVTWSADSNWDLQNANVVTGPYANLAPTSFGVYSNAIPATATNQFYRLQYRPAP